MLSRHQKNHYPYCLLGNRRLHVMCMFKCPTHWQTKESTFPWNKLRKCPCPWAFVSVSVYAIIMRIHFVGIVHCIVIILHWAALYMYMYRLGYTFLKHIWRTKDQRTRCIIMTLYKYPMPVWVSWWNVSQREGIFVLFAPPSGKPSSQGETFHQDTHTGMVYLFYYTEQTPIWYNINENNNDRR